MLWIWLTISLLLSYLLGSIPTAVWIGKSFYGIDVRQHGSGNAGATNTFRVLGKRPGIVVLLIDVLKGFAAVVVAGEIMHLAGIDELSWIKIVAGLVAVVGHIFPIFAQFKGGKGVATILGAVFGINPLASLIALIVFSIILITTHYVSLGSILASMTFPLIVFFIQHEPSIWMKSFSIFVPIMMILTHRPNIERLRHGKENKTYIFKKPDN
ncbi:MAG TPA: glycerol-3-phosphate 1-O-acyltransferase PlsY [Salinivirgaceae bacterium]|nr:glycerol-3-phosphate 1-O-acyltransferase PlsY [Salinivirgaceae bacterium]